MKTPSKSFLLGVFFLILQILVIVRNQNSNPEIFVWFCNHVLLILSIGCFTHNNHLLKGIINVGLIGQLVWSIDFLSKIIFGFHFFNVTNYVFTQPYTFSTALTILIHMFATTIALYHTRKIQPTKKTLLYSISYLLILYIVTLLFTSPQNNINWVFEIGGTIKYQSIFYTIAYPIITIFLVILPTQYLQQKISEYYNK